MSKKISLSDLSDSEKEIIDKDLYLKIESDKKKFNKFTQTEFFQAYDLTDTHVIVPISYNNIDKIKRTDKSHFSTIHYSFNGQLRQKQAEVKDLAIQNLNKNGAFIIAGATAFGKTATSIYLLSVIKMKTVIIVNRVVLMKQWKLEIEKFIVNPKVKILTVKDFDTSQHDIFIINAINIEKFPESFFDDVGLVIVDEIHQIMSKTMAKCLHHLFPRYILGLSATPYRNDGLNFLFDLFFGSEKVFIPLLQKHIVYKIDTNKTPEVEYNSDGSTNWDSILRFQSSDISRNEMIIKCVKYFKSRNILILTKRTEHAKYFISRLQEEKEDVTSLIQSEKTFDSNSRILVSNVSKSGTGFNHPKLDMLIIASDLENYFVQYLGRVFRTETVEPIILDFVDNNKILERHFSSRKKIYKQVGGVFSSLEKNHSSLFSELFS
jgi:superfamily II DNA or RNA helicase